MNATCHAQVKRSDILLSALCISEKLGLIDTKLVDYGQGANYYLEWFSLLEDASRLTCHKDELVAAIQSAHADCSFKSSIKGGNKHGVNLTLKISLPVS